jgi:hypothetical protein
VWKIKELKRRHGGSCQERIVTSVLKPDLVHVAVHFSAIDLEPYPVDCSKREVVTSRGGEFVSHTELTHQNVPPPSMVPPPVMVMSVRWWPRMSAPYTLLCHPYTAGSGHSK